MSGRKSKRKRGNGGKSPKRVSGGHPRAQAQDVGITGRSREFTMPIISLTMPMLFSLRCHFIKARQKPGLFVSFLNSISRPSSLFHPWFPHSGPVIDCVCAFFSRSVHNFLFFCFFPPFLSNMCTQPPSPPFLAVNMILKLWAEEDVDEALGALQDMDYNCILDLQYLGRNAWKRFVNELRCP